MPVPSQYGKMSGNIGQATGILAIALLAAIVLPGVAAAQGVPTDQLILDAERKAEEGAWPPKGRFTISPTFTERYARFNEWLWKDHGVAYLVAPTFMFQGGTQGSPDNYTANEQVKVVFAWEFLRETVVGDSAFVFDFLHLGQLTNATGVDFAQSLGINFFTSDSVGDSDIFKTLMWRQKFPGDVVTLYVGQAQAADIDGGRKEELGAVGVQGLAVARAVRRVILARLADLVQQLAAVARVLLHDTGTGSDDPDVAVRIDVAVV